jgi:hypothetical protein
MKLIAGYMMTLQNIAITEHLPGKGIDAAWLPIDTPRRRHIPADLAVIRFARIPAGFEFLRP